MPSNPVTLFQWQQNQRQHYFCGTLRALCAAACRATARQAPLAFAAELTLTASTSNVSAAPLFFFFVPGRWQVGTECVALLARFTPLH